MHNDADFAENLEYILSNIYEYNNINIKKLKSFHLRMSIFLNFINKNSQSAEILGIVKIVNTPFGLLNVDNRQMGKHFFYSYYGDNIKT